MPTYILCHRHEPAECRFVFAAWRGFDSPLRHGRALASCGRNGQAADARHTIFWTVEAADASAALGYLPAYLTSRTEVVHVAEVPIP
ncbi:hypothetical protein [Frankia sp. EAN1pec]|uniref:hypothetical protein n=1 Tax=Parafrankia sp. (strain EAN1pec) TaxID=298653 RepID=UPI00059CCCB9